MRTPLSLKRHWFPFSLFGLVAVMIASLSWLGRRAWGQNGIPGLWSGKIESQFTSQFVADAYTFTHVLHGIGFYAALVWFFPRWSLRARLLTAVAIEAAWEVIENTSTVIEYYRAATISLNYYGDSIVNSLADLVACVLGFLVAAYLPRWFTILLVIMIEVVLVVTIRDSLILNIIMLVYPVPAIKEWQM